MIKLSIKSNAKNLQGEADLIIDELQTKYRKGDYLYSSSLKITTHNSEVLIMFNFLNDEDLNEIQIHFVEETGFLFFMTCNQYGIADLNKMKLVELKRAFEQGYPERIKNSIIFDDELSAKSYSIRGKFIDEIPIDPPSERIEFNGYLEYVSPIFGRRNLKIV